MHEMALAESVLGVIEDARRRQGFVRVRVVHLEIGALAAVEVEALCSCLEIVLARSAARAARIECAIVPGSGYCLDCGQTVAMDALYAACPHCAGPRVQATDGMQMRIRDLMVE